MQTANIILELLTISITVLQNREVLSVTAKWSKAMKRCIEESGTYLPYTVNDISASNIIDNTWLFHAKYIISEGNVTISLSKVEGNETCPENTCKDNLCKFCENSRHLNSSISSLHALRNYMIPGRTYVLGTYKSQEFPPPDRCMVFKNSSNTKFSNCSEEFEDSCNKKVPEEVSKYRITIALEENNADTTMSSVPTTEGNSVSPSKGRSMNPICEYYIYVIALSGFLLICIFLNILCIYCCVQCQVKRKMRALKTEQIQENPCMPISDAITQIYRKLNDEQELNDEVYTYDLVADMGKKMNFTITGKVNDKAEYDRGFFRQVTQSGDYDMAWSNTWSSPASPDADYAQVQKVSKSAMLSVSEENIYSKQRLPLEENVDDNSQAEDDDIVKIPLLNETSGKDNKDMKEHEKTVSIDEQDINVDDKDNQQENQEEKRATSAEYCQKNKTISSLRDNTLSSEKSEKSINGNSEIGGKCFKEQNNRKCAKARISNRDKKRKSRHASHGEVCDNLPEQLDGNRKKISARKAAKMVDDTTEIVTNLNIVSSNTKL